jgi:hypothetical protein
MRRPLSRLGPLGMPQPPGRTPHGAGLRASGTTQPQAPLRCPGGEDPASHTAILHASGTTKRPAGLRASGTASREGGRELSTLT